MTLPTLKGFLIPPLMWKLLEFLKAVVNLLCFASLDLPYHLDIYLRNCARH